MSTLERRALFSDLSVLLLAGGVGGAKLADGLAQVLPAENITIIVNTGDDFEHLGLKISPDVDTIIYTLAGVANPETGWGRIDESWRTIDEIGRLGGPDWFLLGDLDLATHLTRTHMLAEGMTLTAVTRHLCQHFGVQANVLPMSDQVAPTWIESETETLPFQVWFVKEKWQPRVKRILLPGNIKASSQCLAALERADIVIIAPSNPFVSVDPILNVYPIREMVMDLPQAVVAISPIIGGRAVKGPAAKMMEEMEMPVTASAIATYYGTLIDGFVYDLRDEGSLDALDVAQSCVNTWMHTQDDRGRLAYDVMEFAAGLMS
jgi:LPPG:FO 2-phospho-L-lactate transferase